MYLNPDNWVRFFRDKLLQMETPLGEGESELTEDDMSELDRFMEDQEQAWKDSFQQTLGGTHTMSGAQAPVDWRQMNAQPLQWGPWQ